MTAVAPPARRTMRAVHDRSCAVACTARIIGRRWTSFLELEGVVARRRCPESPPRVEYDLTAKGRGLLGVIAAMRAFGREWLVDDPAHRRRHGL